ncbi:hypothetical protein NXC14_PA00366 (plasmid) [Rhizobium sp. NXC14]|nr:hypothetical protein NXC14_PA00366 [Rhizobium sp. NXC14]
MERDLRRCSVSGYIGQARALASRQTLKRYLEYARRQGRNINANLVGSLGAGSAAAFQIACCGERCRGEAATVSYDAHVTDLL